MNSGLNRPLRTVQQGDPVVPGPVDVPLNQLASDVNYLYELIQAATLGSTIVASQVTVEPDALVGMPVFYNSQTQRFERSLASAFNDPNTGIFRVSPSGIVWGVVKAKTNATLADLVLYGYLPLDLSAAVVGPVSAGVYYLSSSTPGQLVLGKPPIAIAVLRSDGNGNVFVDPEFIDYLDRHVHYEFPLVTAPAGDTSPPGMGQRHTITNPNPALPGWLPANHPSFNGKAPPDACFGYNLAAQPLLAQVWPPLPLQGASLMWDKAISPDIGATQISLGPQGLAIIDLNGIWWMSNCLGDVPWPEDLDTAHPTSISADPDTVCPRELEMQMAVWFSRPIFATEATAVTNLKSVDPRVIVDCQTGGPGSTGPLQIALNLAFLISQTNVAGGVVLKNLVNNGNGFTQGWVVESIYSTSPNVTLTGDNVIPLDPTNPTGTKQYQGKVDIQVSTLPSLEIPVELVRLDAVVEEFFENVMFLGFLPGQLSSYRGRLRIPSDITLANPKLALKFSLIGLAAGTLPALTVTARRIPLVTSPATLPDNSTEFAVTINTAVTLTGANQYVEVTATPFNVVAGDVIFFTVQRGSSDGYVEELGVVNQAGLLSGG